MPARKRAASTVLEEPRRSRRVSAGRKSTYFESDAETDANSSAEPDTDSDGSESSEPIASAKAEAKKSPAARRRGRPAGSTARGKASAVVLAKPKAKVGRPRTKANRKNEDEDQDAKEVGEDDDGRRVRIIPHEQLRDDGGQEYTDDTVHKNTLLFLKDLRANNSRSWLKNHDKEYRRSLKDWQSFVETMTEKLIEVDEEIPELPARDVIFRIYRDVRFSKDPTPYKAHYSAAWSRTGRKGSYACYYVHCEPGASFVGGGLWHPENGSVRQLRQSIDERPARWRRVLADEGFRREWLPGGARGGEEAALRAFAERNKEGALKTKPQGYHPEHRDIELLKLKNFTVGKKIDEGIFTEEDGQERLARMFSSMVGFVHFLNGIVMPDRDADDDSDDD